MRVAVTGATGVIGRRAVAALVDAGHEVAALSRTAASDALLGALRARPVRGDLFDPAALERLLTGCDAVVNLASRVPVGLARWSPGGWRANTKIRTLGVSVLLEAARAADVRRVVQPSVSSVYADLGDEWITEQSTVDITGVIEPVAVAESRVQAFEGGPRAAVILRLGGVIGEDPLSLCRLRAARQRRPVVLGSPEGWAHVVHTDDLGSAVLAALTAPSGLYNVGAGPVRRRVVAEAFAAAAGASTARFVGPISRRLAGPRLEALGRSLRVCSDHFIAQTGWTPSRPVFDADWVSSPSRDPERVPSR